MLRKELALRVRTACACVRARDGRCIFPGSRAPAGDFHFVPRPTLFPFGTLFHQAWFFRSTRIGRKDGDSVSPGFTSSVYMNDSIWKSELSTEQVTSDAAAWHATEV